MRKQVADKIKSLLKCNPVFSDQMKQEVLDYIANADSDDLIKIAHGLAAEDSARGKILQRNANDLRNLASRIKEENYKILETFAALIQEAEASAKS